jgi:hypothetical protein
MTLRLSKRLLPKYGVLKNLSSTYLLDTTEPPISMFDPNVDFDKIQGLWQQMEATCQVRIGKMTKFSLCLATQEFVIREIARLLYSCDFSLELLYNLLQAAYETVKQSNRRAAFILCMPKEIQKEEKFNDCVWQGFSYVVVELNMERGNLCNFWKRFLTVKALELQDSVALVKDNNE